MKMPIRLIVLAVVLSISLVLTACGGGGTPAPAAAPGGNTGPVTLDLASVGENLAFDKTALTVASGQQVTIKFTDTSTAQQHNWILVKGGDDVAQKVATDGLSTGADNNYLPADKSSIFAYTPLANAGQVVEVTFTAPAPGTYTYLCSVPGHYPLMKGTLTVN